jgi:hypothetical protein
MPPKKQTSDQTKIKQVSKSTQKSKQIQPIPKVKLYSQTKTKSKVNVITTTLTSQKQSSVEKNKIDSEEKTSLLKKENEEISKWKCNIVNGVLGMNRDINIKLTKYFKNNVDLIEVCFFFFFLFICRLFAQILNSLLGSNISHLKIFDVSIYLLLFYLYLKIIVLLEIPPFVKDPCNPKEFNIIENRIIEANEYFCHVFLDRKIEENTNIWKMFFNYYYIIK